MIGLSFFGGLEFGGDDIVSIGATSVCESTLWTGILFKFRE